MSIPYPQQYPVPNVVLAPQVDDEEAATYYEYR